MTQGELLYSLPASVTKNTFTTITVVSAAAASSVPRCVIPAGYFSTIGKALKVKAAGTITSVAGTATFVWTAGLDTTGGTLNKTLFASATDTPAITTVFPWDLDMDITAQAVGQAGTTLQVNATMRRNNVASSGAWGTGTLAAMFSNSVTAVDSEVNQYLELFGTWSVSNAANSTTLQQFKVYGEN